MTIHDGMQWILHADQALVLLYSNYGIWCYLILSLIVFSETAFIIFPFLPGDSLLFAVGALSATLGESAFPVFLTVLSGAAIAGNQCNYWIGKYIGNTLVKHSHDWKRRLKVTERLDRAQQFYLAHGGKALVLSRFMPVLRSFVPFSAGMSRMPGVRYFLFNVVGALLWVPGLITLGFIFGRVPWVQEHFSALILLIIFVSLLPVGISYWKTR